MIIQNAPFDPLSDVISLAGLRAACSVRLQAGGDWALRFRPLELKFNVVRQGHCWLLVEGSPPRHLHAGDCFVVARTPFVLASAPEVPAVDAAQVFSPSGTSARYGVGNDVELLGGSVTLQDSPGAADLVNLLPAALVITADAGGASPLAWLLEELDREWHANLAGSQAVCNDLLRLMFVHALRQHIAQADAADLGWLGGLRDPAIAASLRAVHGEPARTWRLEELAAIAGLSRSSFAARFKRCVGLAPIEYAARWRMGLAAARLLNTADPVGVIAASLGFLSDAAFGVSFRRVHGMSPGRYRRHHAERRATS